VSALVASPAVEGRSPSDPVLGGLDARGVKFLTLRMRSPALIRHINTLRPAEFTTITLDRPGRTTGRKCTRTRPSH
jgi:hypothetical protein